MASVQLAPVLDLAAAAPLRSTLLAHRGQELELGADAVVRLGGQCLQVLLAAKRTWQSDGHELRLAHASEPLREALRITNAESLLGGEG